MNRELLRLAIPNIISNITVPLLSIVDTALMGRLSAGHIAAVGLASMLFNFLYWNFGFLRMGTTGLTAQAYGAEDKPLMMERLVQSAALALLLAAMLVLFRVPILRAGNYLFATDPAMVNLVGDYFLIRIWAAPASLLLMTVLGWFFGMQNAVFPLVISILINVFNIAVSYYLVVVQGWEIRGVAMGTVAAQYLGLLLALVLFFWRYRIYLSHWPNWAALHWERLRHFLLVNRDIFLRTFCLTFAFFFFYRQSSLQGVTILAVNTLLLHFLNMMSYGVDGFAFAAESLVGKYQGAKAPQQVEKAIRLSFIWGLALAVGYAATYGLMGDDILGLLTTEQSLIASATPYLFWMILLPVLSTPCYIWDGIYVGLTAARPMRDAMILALGVYLLAWYLLMPRYGNHGLWASLILFMVFRAVFLWWMYHWRVRKTLYS